MFMTTTSIPIVTRERPIPANNKTAATTSVDKPKIMAKVAAIESLKFPSVHASVTFLIPTDVSMDAYNFYAQINA